MNAPLSEEDHAAIRASPTVLCWKRATDLPSHLRILQGKCKAPTSGNATTELSYSAVFPPTDQPLRGVILFLHGVNEYSERYFHAFEELCKLGFGVLAYDLRSHGKSAKDVEPLVAHVESFPSLIDDTNDFLDFAKAEIYPKMLLPSELPQQPPLLIMGMSLGSLVTLQSVLSGKHTFHGIVLLAPAISVEWTPVLRAMALMSTMLAALFPKARLVPGVNRDFICRDPLFGKDYDADPLTTSENITCRMANETMHAMDALHKDKRVEDANHTFCTIPILMMMGTEDKVTSLPLAQQFYDRIQTKDKQFVLVQDAFHVLFEDNERAFVLQQLATWLHVRFPVPAA